MVVYGIYSAKIGFIRTILVKVLGCLENKNHPNTLITARKPGKLNKLNNKHTRTQTHTHIHAHTYTHTLTRTLTQTHAHTLSQEQSRTHTRT